MKDPSQILQESAETHDKKDADYGTSWRAIGHILHGLSKGEPVVLETPEDFISFGLFTRRMDKIARCFNGEFLSDELNFESIADSHADETAYAAMHASLLGEQEPVEYVRDEEIQEIDPNLKVGGEPVGEVTDFSIGFQTEEDYDDALPIDPEYQAKYEELTGER